MAEVHYASIHMCRVRSIESSGESEEHYVLMLPVLTLNIVADLTGCFNIKHHFVKHVSCIILIVDMKSAGASNSVMLCMYD